MGFRGLSGHREIMMMMMMVMVMVMVMVMMMMMMMMMMMVMVMMTDDILNSSRHNTSRAFSNAKFS